MQQNVTLKLDRGLLKQAKLYAHQQNKSLSRLLTESLLERVHSLKDYLRAKKKALSLLNKGLPLGGGPYTWTREDLHER